MHFKQKLRLAGLAVAAIVLLILIFQNKSNTTLSFLFISTTMPLAMLIGVVFVAGMGVGVVLAYWMLGKKVEIKALKDA